MVNNKEVASAGFSRVSSHWERVKQSFLILAVSVIIGAASLPIQAEGATLDSESIRCMSCHNENTPFDTADHHPVGVAYSEATPLDPLIRLFNNRIVCGSCHVPYSEANHQTLSDERSAFPSIPDPLLVMDNRRSELCLACHNK